LGFKFERRIDRRILLLILGIISQTLATAKVKVGDNHELTFELKPQVEEVQPASEEVRSAFGVSRATTRSNLTAGT